MNRYKIVASALAALPLAGLLFTASPAAAATLTRQLQVGMSGSDVSALQTFLATNASWYPQGLVTGYFGPLTEQAVLRFQTANGITAVGRVGPITLAAINNQMNGGTGTGTSGTNMAGQAPTISPLTGNVSVNGTSATITWSTNEPSTNTVMYGTSWPFLYATAPSVSQSGLTTSASVTLQNLQHNTTYYYVLQSVDAAGDLQWTTAHSFTTGA